MKVYEVFVCVPYCDPDGNQEYTRKNGTFFVYKYDAEAYMNKMFNDKKANEELKKRPDYGAERRYVYLSDYKNVDFDWNDLYGWSLLEEKSKTELDNLEAILETNSLVDDMKYYDAILLAVTYCGNRWYLREVEVHFEVPERR